MLNRILAVAALGLAVGLAACDQAGQEQAQEPTPAPPAQEQTQQGQTPPPSQPQEPPAERTEPPPPSGQTPPAGQNQ